jgi:hypothetical protein
LPKWRKPFVVVINRHRQDTLGRILADHILIEQGRNFLGRRQFAFDPLAALVAGDFVANDIVAQLDAFITDEHRRPGDQLLHFMLALAAKRAVEKLFGATFLFRHVALPHSQDRWRLPGCEIKIASRLASTLSIKPYSAASCAERKLSRSVSRSMRSIA